MLPFLNKKRIASVIIASRKPTGSIDAPAESEGEQGDESGVALQSAANDMISAIKSNDVARLADALRSAFEILESEEEEEGKENDNSFEAMNEKAGENE